MNIGYDIFRRLGDGSPLWVAKADSLGHARESVEVLARSAPGNYFIRDATTGLVVSDPLSPGSRFKTAQ